MSRRAIPLRTQLTAMGALLLVAALTLAGVTALSLLRQSLVGQLDQQLARALPLLVQRAAGGIPGGGPGDAVAPSDYHVAFLGVDGEHQAVWRTTSEVMGAPDLSGLTVERVLERGGLPFTVGPAEDGVRWRVVARPLVADDGSLLGSVAVGLPMAAADATVDSMRTALVGVGVAVVGLGALAGWWAVRRALRPLSRIEDTAAAFAAGDLSRRVPDADPRTEVGRLARALNGMLAQVEEAIASRTASGERMRRFVADASHELRTPLAAIRGYGELYQMGALRSPAEVSDTFMRIERSATRMGRLVDDLLALARLDEGRPLRRGPVDLAVLAADAVADLRALDPDRPVRLERLAAGGTFAGALTLADEDRLRQVLANLVGNVVQHTPAGTPVEIAVGRVGDGQSSAEPDAGRVTGRTAGATRGDVHGTDVDGADADSGAADSADADSDAPRSGAPGRGPLAHGPSVVLEVRDHGPGIPPDHAGRVFERFYRVDPARGRDSGGSGLGMAIVAAIVAAHGGDVSLRPTPGGGATVRVLLPAAPARHGTSPAGEPHAPEAPDYDDQSLSPTR